MNSMVSNRIYVWTWLPGQSAPVLAGVLDHSRDVMRFGYVGTYLERSDAIPLGPELPLRSGFQDPEDGLMMHSCIRDGAPDSWGRRVIADQFAGGRFIDVDSLDESDYLLHSGSDRFGALDFQESATEYVGREEEGTVEELMNASALLEEGVPLSPAMEVALLHGTSIGGARPKAVLRDEDGHGWLSKFSSTTDVYPVIKAEIAGNVLARRAGIVTPDFRVEKVAGKLVLLTQRFDRGSNGTRRHTLSSLTLLKLHEQMGYYGTYPEILDVIRASSRFPDMVGSELFRRIAFNIAIGNTDDHARNHAVFWDGRYLDLTPAYDLTPAIRTGLIANQAMAYGRNGERASSLSLLASVSHEYDLTASEGMQIVQDVIESIRDGLPEAVDIARLSANEARTLAGSEVRGRAILNEGALLDLSLGVRTAVPYQSAGEVWVKPHTRKGKHVDGHWRQHPAR